MSVTIVSLTLESMMRRRCEDNAHLSRGEMVELLVSHYGINYPRAGLTANLYHRRGLA